MVKGTLLRMVSDVDMVTFHKTSGFEGLQKGAFIITIQDLFTPEYGPAKKVLCKHGVRVLPRLLVRNCFSEM